MAQNVVINGVTYSSVPNVNIPKSSGGTAVFYDTSGASVTANDVRNGVPYFGADGAGTGNLDEVSLSTTSISSKDQTITVTAGIHSGSQSVGLSSTEKAKLVAGNIKSGVTLFGVAGGLSSVSVSQDASTKVLSIS